MGFAQRESGKVFVRSDNFQIIKDQNKAKELLVKNLAIKRKGISIFIYKEFDFEEFYKKHCQRIPNDNKPFTVLVDDDIKIPDIKDIRKRIEESLEKGRIERKEKEIIVEIPEYLFKPKLYIRTIDKGKFITDTVRGKFRFRDIKKISKIDINLNRKEILTKENFDVLNSLWKASFTEESDYSFKEILLIEHTDIIF